MAWTAPKTWVVGEVLTAANLNVHLRDNLNALNGSGPGGFIRGKINSDGSIASGTGFSVTAHTTGLYTITFTVPFSAAPIVLCTADEGVSAVFIEINTGPSASSFVANPRNTSAVSVDIAFGFVAIPVS
jgi:hypothetical protein